MCRYLAVSRLQSVAQAPHRDHVARVGGIGLDLALILSKQKMGFKEETFQEVVKIMQNLKLPLKDESLSAKKLVEHMMHDKKTSNNQIKYILISNIGEASWGNVLSEEEIVSAIKTQQALN